MNKLSAEKRATILRCLVDGMSIRGTSRIKEFERIQQNLEQSPAIKAIGQFQQNLEQIAESQGAAAKMKLAREMLGGVDGARRAR